MFRLAPFALASSGHVGTNMDNIVEHLANLYKKGELDYNRYAAIVASLHFANNNFTDFILKYGSFAGQGLNEIISKMPTD